jgi:hypothetical protein
MGIDKTCLYYADTQYHRAFIHTDSIGFHFTSKEAARAYIRQARPAGVVVRIGEFTPNQIERDSLAISQGKVGESIEEQMYALILQKLDAPRPDVLDHIKQMDEKLIRNQIAEFTGLPDSLQYKARVMRARYGSWYTISVDGHIIETHTSFQKAHLRKQEIIERVSQPIAAHITITNPLLLPDLGTWSIQTITRAIGEDLQKFMIKNHHCSLTERYEQLRSSLQTSGYDGIMFVNEVHDPGSKSYLVFNADAISIIQNSERLEPAAVKQ